MLIAAHRALARHHNRRLFSASSSTVSTAFREAMRFSHCTPVAIVTAAIPTTASVDPKSTTLHSPHAAVVRGATIGSFTSVSLRPPIVSFSLHRPSGMDSHLARASHCEISVLSRAQTDVAALFADSRRADEQSDFLLAAAVLSSASASTAKSTSATSHSASERTTSAPQSSTSASAPALAIPRALCRLHCRLLHSSTACVGDHAVWFAEVEDCSHLSDSALSSFSSSSSLSASSPTGCADSNDTPLLYFRRQYVSPAVDQRP